MEEKNKDILKSNTNKDPGFSLPENYFSDFEKDFHMDVSKVKSGFKEPENYFKNVEERIMSKVNNSGFKIPENYFKEIDETILNNYNKSKHPKVYNLVNSTKFKFIGLSIAASLLIFIGLNNTNSQNAQLEFETLEIAEIESWMDNDLLSYNTYDILDTFDDITLSNEEIFTSEVIYDYLVEENIGNLLNE